MNGSHDNFQFTQIASNDPTANADGTYTDESGAGLRDTDRFCLWCQEVVVLRILEKTDQFLEDGDPSDATSQGVVWYTRWIHELRASYYALFDVSAPIAAAEARYAPTGRRATSLVVNPANLHARVRFSRRKVRNCASRMGWAR